MCLLSPATHAQENFTGKAQISFSQLTDGPMDKIVYKSVSDVPLHLYVFHSKDVPQKEKRTALVIIHGGGWTGGDVEAFSLMPVILLHVVRQSFVLNTVW